MLPRLLPLLTSLIILCSNACAQTCSYEKNEIDKFTREKTQLTAPLRIATKNIKVKRVYNIEHVDMQARLTGEQRVLILTFYFALGLSVPQQNDKLLLLMSNGQTLELTCSGQVPGVKYKGMGVTVISSQFGIDNASFSKLCASNITDVRVLAAINPVEFPVKEGIATYPLFRCIR